jgi:F-type H+-transporting ATPase subunit b
MIESAQTAAEAVQATEAAGGIGALGVNLKLFLAQLVNFGVLVFVMWKWVYGPLMKKMDERTKKIQDGLDFAKQATEQLNDAEAERTKTMRQAKAEAYTLMEDAAAKAESYRKEKVAQTGVEIERMVDDAKVRLSQERDATYESLKTEIAGLVALATKKIALGMDEKSKEKLVTQAIKDIGNS